MQCSSSEKKLLLKETFENAILFLGPYSYRAKKRAALGLTQNLSQNFLQK